MFDLEVVGFAGQFLAFVVLDSSAWVYGDLAGSSGEFRREPMVLEGDSVVCYLLGSYPKKMRLFL